MAKKTLSKSKISSVAAIGYLTACLFPQVGFAQSVLPENPEVVTGDISFDLLSPQTLNVTQTMDSGIINWDSFSVSSGNTVSFDNGSGATLNRVTGDGLSEIYGTLDATGSLYLINENGIVFGETGVVRTGLDFIASTLDVNNAEFLAGREVLFSSDSDAFVVNYGSLFSEQGDIALISRNTENRGSIFAPQGTASIVAGREILMRDANLDDGRFLVRIGGDDTSVTEAGTIRAAEVELRTNGGNIYALAGNTDGMVQATGVSRQKDGRVFLTAGKTGTVSITKTIQSKNRNGNGGAIRATGQNVDVSGTLDASSMFGTGGTVHILAGMEAVFTGSILAFGTREDGTGGFAEISGDHSLKHSGHVDTGNGTLLLDPDNIEIAMDSISPPFPGLDGASIILDTQIYSDLLTNNVVIQTSGLDAEAGTIYVGTALEYDRTNSLTLMAHGDIILDGSIQNSNSSSGDINLVAGWDGSTSTMAFDPADFDVADVSLATTFGNANGVDYFFSFDESSAIASGSIDMSSTSDVRVGSRSGTTRFYANDIFAESDYSSLQVGFFALNEGVGYTVAGDIEVNAVGDVILSGDQFTGYGGTAQIGHIGSDFFSIDTITDGNATGDITIKTGGSVNLVGGTGFGELDSAQIGHGGGRTTGDFSGDISIQTGGGVNLSEGASALSFVQIGHGDASETGVGSHQGNIDIVSDGEISIQLYSYGAGIGHDTGLGGSISNSDITLVATGFDGDVGSSIAPSGLGVIGGGLVQTGKIGGDVSIKATDSGIMIEDFISYDSAHQLLIDVSDDFVLSSFGEVAGTISNSGTGDVIISAGGVFENSSMSLTPITTTGGRWIVYSERPDLNTQDIEITNRDFLAYGITFDEANPINATLPMGSGLVYSVTPNVEFTASDQFITYGDTIASSDVTSSLTAGGSAVTAADFGIDLAVYDPTVTVASGLATSTAGFVNAGSYTDGLEASVTTSSPPILGVSTSLIDGDLSVSQYYLNVGMTAVDRAYDGTTDVSLNILDDRLTGDVLSVSATGTMAEKNVGLAKTVAISGVAISGTDGANYSLSEFSSFDEVDISQRNLIVNAAGVDRTYDGTTVVDLTFSDDRVTGDILTVVGTGSVGDKNVGAAKAVTVTGLGISGTDSTNYSVTSVSNAPDVDISQLALDVTATATDRVYDGTTDVDLSFADNRLTGDVLAVAGSGSVADKSAGIAKAVTVSGLAISGTDSGNYSVSSVSNSADVDIAQLGINVTASAEDKQFDGTVAATVSVSSSEILAGDTVSFSATGEFLDSAVGNDKDVYVFDILAGGADGLNYNVLSAGTYTTASIFALAGEVPRQDAIPEGTPTTTAALDPVPGPVESEMEILSDLATDTIVQDLSQGNSFCRQIAQKEYVVDCMSDRLAEVAASLPTTGAYAETRAALEVASRKLAALARQNASDALPPKRIRTRSLTGPASSRKLVPVRNATSPSVLAQAQAIIKEAETVLLRSAESSERRKVQYKRIAKAVGSNVVLLRSL